jgi:hypothetical protein
LQEPLRYGDQIARKGAEDTNELFISVFRNGNIHFAVSDINTRGMKVDLFERIKADNLFWMMFLLFCHIRTPYIENGKRTISGAGCCYKENGNLPSGVSDKSEPPIKKP